MALYFLLFLLLNLGGSRGSVGGKTLNRNKFWKLQLSSWSISPPLKVILVMMTINTATSNAGDKLAFDVDVQNNSSLGNLVTTYTGASCRTEVTPQKAFLITVFLPMSLREILNSCAAYALSADTVSSRLLSS